MSALCKKSRAHCPRSVTMRAQVRPSPRPMNQSALQMCADVDGVKWVGPGNWKLLPFAAAASCWEIWVNSCTVEFPESGINVL
jgi:hypothetical protein